MAAGRRREFDKHEALDKAMRVFWNKGFVGASLTDLTMGMGINKPSMYAAFGNKEQLFIKAFEHYINHYAMANITLLKQTEKTVAECVKDFLVATVESQCSKDNPKGCYISLCVSESASEDMPDEALGLISQVKDFTEDYLTQFFEEQKSKGNLSKNLKSAELSLYLVTILHGTAAMARGGKSKQELHLIVKRALSSIEF